MPLFVRAKLSQSQTAAVKSKISNTADVEFGLSLPAHRRQICPAFRANAASSLAKGKLLKDLQKSRSFFLCPCLFERSFYKVES